jgi:hypothetical protein
LKQDKDSTEVNGNSGNEKDSNGKKPTLFEWFQGYLDKFESLKLMVEYKKSKGYFDHNYESPLLSVMDFIEFFL